MRHRTRALLIAGLVTWLTVACGGESGPPGPQGDVRLLAVIEGPLGVPTKGDPLNGVSQVAWIGDWLLGYDGPVRQVMHTIDAQLYLADPDFTNIRPHGPKFRDMRGTPWSPDGRWILVSGIHDRTNGLWIVESTTAEVRLIAKGRYGINPSAWSPDGTRVAVRSYTDGTDPAVIAVFDVTPLLQ